MLRFLSGQAKLLPLRGISAPLSRCVEIFTINFNANKKANSTSPDYAPGQPTPLCGIAPLKISNSEDEIRHVLRKGTWVP